MENEGADVSRRWWLRRRARAPLGVSVVLCTFNGARFLEEQLHSLAAQSRRPDELIVGDDRSTDDWLAVLRAFARDAPFPVRIRRNWRRLRFARNFIATARRASGSVLLFSDQDDIWRSDKIERCVAELAGARSDVLTHDIAIFGDRSSMASYYAHLDGIGLRRSISYKGCSMAVTRDFLDFWGWPPPGSTMSHDFWIAALATAFGRRTHLDEPLVAHRLHGRNASGWIASAADLPGYERATPADLARLGDFETMVRSTIKGDRRRRWARTLARTIIRRRARLEPRLVDASLRVLAQAQDEAS